MIALAGHRPRTYSRRDAHPLLRTQRGRGRQVVRIGCSALGSHDGNRDVRSRDLLLYERRVLAFF